MCRFYVEEFHCHVISHINFALRSKLPLFVARIPTTFNVLGLDNLAVGIFLTFLLSAGHFSNLESLIFSKLAGDREFLSHEFWAPFPTGHAKWASFGWRYPLDISFQELECYEQNSLLSLLECCTVSSLYVEPYLWADGKHQWQLQYWSWGQRKLSLGELNSSNSWSDLWKKSNFYKVPLGYLQPVDGKTTVHRVPWLNWVPF